VDVVVFWLFWLLQSHVITFWQRDGSMLRGSLSQPPEDGQWSDSGEQSPPESRIGGRIVDSTASAGAAPGWLRQRLVGWRSSCRGGGRTGTGARNLLHVPSLLAIPRIVVDAKTIADVRRAGHIRYGGKELAISPRWFLVCFYFWFDVVGWLVGWVIGWLI